MPIPYRSAPDTRHSLHNASRTGRATSLSCRGRQNGT